MTHRNTLPLATEPARLWLLELAIAAVALAPRPAAANDEKEEIAHPFFTHEGLPDSVGSYSARGSAPSSRIDGAGNGDFAFHLGTPAR